MPATPETKAKRRIQNLLADFRKQGLPMKLTWNAGAAFGSATVDCTGVIDGTPMAIEVKRFDGRGKVTARQVADLREFHAAGAVTMLIDGEQSFAHLEAFLMRKLAWKQNGLEPSRDILSSWSRLP